MSSSTTFIADDSDVPDNSGQIDAQFYQRQVPSSGPFGDNAFALAAARARDKARVKLIRAIQAEQDQKALDELIPQSVLDVATGKSVTAAQAGGAFVKSAGGMLLEFLSDVVFL
jgi:hypothetical protein